MGLVDAEAEEKTACCEVDHECRDQDECALTGFGIVSASYKTDDCHRNTYLLILEYHGDLAGDALALSLATAIGEPLSSCDTPIGIGLDVVVLKFIVASGEGVESLETVLCFEGFLRIQSHEVRIVCASAGVLKTTTESE